MPLFLAKKPSTVSLLNRVQLAEFRLTNYRPMAILLIKTTWPAVFKCAATDGVPGQQSCKYYLTITVKQSSSLRCPSEMCQLSVSLLDKTEAADGFAASQKSSRRLPCSAEQQPMTFLLPKIAVDGFPAQQSIAADGLPAFQNSSRRHSILVRVAADGVPTRQSSSRRRPCSAEFLSNERLQQHLQLSCCS